MSANDASKEAANKRAAERMRKWRIANPELSAQRTAAYYQRNRVKKDAQIKAWREANPEKFRAMRERQYEKRRQAKAKARAAGASRSD